MSYPFLTIGVDIAKGGSSSETLKRSIERQGIIMVSANSEIEKPLFLDREQIREKPCGDPFLYNAFSFIYSCENTVAGKFIP